MGKDKELIVIRILQVFVLLCIFYVFAFYVLKVTGVINTPLWVELSPAIAGVVASATVIVGVVQFYVRLKDLPESHQQLTRRVDRMAIGLARVEKDVDYLRTDMHRRFDIVEKRLEKLENKIDTLCRCKNYRPMR